MLLPNHGVANCPFNKLPIELKELVLQYSMPTEVPEIAFLPGGLRPIIPLGPRPDDSAEHYLIIYTAYPVLMHVCREWRGFAVARTTLRYSQTALMDVPTRQFRPEIDVLYIPAVDSSPVWFSADRHCSTTRHIAMQPQTFLNYGARSLALMTYFTNMETLTIILPSSTGRHSLHAAFSAPTARCRLRRISGASLNDLGTLSVVHERGPEARSPGQVARVSALLHWVEVVVQRTAQYLWATQEWDSSQHGEQNRNTQASPFEILVQTFIEYRYENGSYHWMESRER
ncbi:hypothetical protein BKA67DRAFT_81286 [Truncatella angustata]|uniref:2EXR domain-containing protein n=1 Tax=Truncatella angustata TaxID=152316 RepID=A0A9P8UZL8_9PEZI|nr:uncharacterized protein BKA67DRAFT_81286 [Truncatella angustata]KAH6661303.1 hypothetical protein BKA67DRAFT_81286 [Truncatella angustata]